MDLFSAKQGKSINLMGQRKLEIFAPLLMVFLNSRHPFPDGR